MIAWLNALPDGGRPYKVASFAKLHPRSKLTGGGGPIGEVLEALCGEDDEEQRMEAKD